MERMKKHLPKKERQKDFEDGVASGSNPKVKLIPRGEKIFIGQEERMGAVILQKSIREKNKWSKKKKIYNYLREMTVKNYQKCVRPDLRLEFKVI